MSKERLERIEHNAERTALLTKPPQPLVTISDNDFEWLIKQAGLGVSQQEQFHDYQAQNLRLQERLDKLEDKLQELRKRYLTLTKENNQVNDELIDEFRKNKRYREALEFYAKENNHVFWEDIREGENFVQLPISETDKGYIARKALEGEE